jgi:hypothetical protein
MAISSNLERINYDSPDGCIATGLHREVIQSVGATRTLLPEESGALCLFDRAAGVVYTLPTPVEGMQFMFSSTVLVTSNSYKIITATPASQFLIGSLMGGSLTVADSGDVFQADGTTHVAITMGGSTTGGLVGGSIKLTAISTTQWLVEGDFVASGTVATPFATS